MFKRFWTIFSFGAPGRDVKGSAKALIYSTHEQALRTITSFTLTKTQIQLCAGGVVTWEAWNILQRFYNTLLIDAYVNLQRFYKAPLMPAVYRDFMMHCLSSICRDFKRYMSLDNLCKCEIYKYFSPIYGLNLYFF